MNHRRVATVNFINQGNCIVTKELAATIEINKQLYRAETPVFLRQELLHIHDVFYKNVDDDVAALWGVLKVSYKI